MWSGFSAVLVLLCVVSIVSVWTLIEVSTNYKSILDYEVRNVELAGEIEVIQKDMATAMLEYVAYRENTAIQNVDQLIEEGSVAARELIESITDEESLVLLEDLKVNTVQLFESNEIIINNMQANKEFDTEVAQSVQLNSFILGILGELKDIQKKNMEQNLMTIDNERQEAIGFIGIITCIVIISGVLISYFTSKSIARPIRKMTEGLKQVAAGNLLVEQVNIKNKDEIGDMAQSFNQMTVDLRSTLMSVQDSSMQLAANAEELSASSEESYASSQLVAKSAELQKSIGQEQMTAMTTSMQSLHNLTTDMVQIATDNHEMLDSTDEVKVLITKGAAVVTDVVKQMDTIHGTFKETTGIMNEMAKHSSDIQTITALITDISDQTNLLALNAAIEAARAGEYGKGFAVVAGEVRNLAEQSKKSATEIEVMVKVIQAASANAVNSIASGSERVEEGLAKTNESLVVFTDIEQGVSDVVHIVERVSTSIVGIQHHAGFVSENVANMQQLALNAVDQATDTSAATEQQLASNEEIASNAQSLANLAETLQMKVQQFKI